MIYLFTLKIYIIKLKEKLAKNVEGYYALVTGDITSFDDYSKNYNYDNKFH